MTVLKPLSGHVGWAEEQAYMQRKVETQRELRWQHLDLRNDLNRRWGSEQQKGNTDGPAALHRQR